MDEAATALDADAPPAWARPAADVVAGLETGADGLDDDEAARRLAVHGANRLPAPRRGGPLARFARQFKNVLIYALLAAAVLAAAIGHELDALVILAVVLVNAAIGFVQEGRAESALAALSQMLEPEARVLRGGRRRTVAAATLVPGDVVLLEAGERVPADLRLVEARELKVDEAILTGESVAADKQTAPVPASAALGDRTSMAFSGTLVVAGTARGVVAATGADTELGRISALLGGVETLKTPLLRQMDAFGRRLTLIILGLAAAVFAVAVGLRGYPFGEAFMAVVGLAVAAIPEGLPAVMTITLAIGTERLAAKNAIIRRLPAVETLGSVSVIGSDKTGTLTKNEMTAAVIALADHELAIEGAGYRPEGAFRRDGARVDPRALPASEQLLRGGLLCNDAELVRTDDDWRAEGDPTEAALVVAAVKAGFDARAERAAHRRLDAVPFDSQHRYMATLHEGPGGERRIVAKGAPERILPMCRTQAGPHGSEPLAEHHWHHKAHELAASGKRLLAIAQKPAARDHHSLAARDVDGDLEFLGLVGLIDPPREEAREAVAACRRAGIDVKMITGDHAVTAEAIARELGLPQPEQALTGPDLDRIDDDELPARVHHTSVFARTSPEHKLRLVRALQARGGVVAMTGDGVNDAPALKRADVGVAMGKKGSEATKEAAEMVLADDHFATIVAAVREGRTVYDNLKKFIGWTLPTNGGQAFAIVAAIAAGLALPITAVQILWVNMITAVGLGLTLAFEPTEPRTMRRPPRPSDEPLLSVLLLWRVGFVSALFVAGAFGTFFWALDQGHSVDTARTMVVNAIVAMQIAYLFSARFAHASAVNLAGLRATRAVWIGVGVVVLAQLAFTTTPPMQHLFATTGFAATDLTPILAAAVMVFALAEAEKAAKRRLDLGRRRRHA
ncbi:MAG: HAD-IC family P-type ATPase [Alphaproteobacteria bacterium]